VHCNSLCIYVRIMIVIFNVFLSIMNFQTPLAELCLQRAPYMFCGIVLCLVMMRWHACHWSLVATTRVGARVNGPSWRVTGFHYPSTRLVISASGNRYPLAELTGWSPVGSALNSGQDIAGQDRQFRVINLFPRTTKRLHFVSLSVCLSVCLARLLTNGEMFMNLFVKGSPLNKDQSRLHVHFVADLHFVFA